MVIMTKATIRIPKDAKHRIVIPNEIWEAENLKEGDIIEVDFIKLITKQKWVNSEDTECTASVYPSKGLDTKNQNG